MGTSSCKRAFLLHYFEEKLRSKPKYCCSNCNLELTEFYGKADLKQETITKKEKHWEEILTELFLIGN